MRRVRVTFVVVEKGIRITCFEGVFVAIVILYAMRMFRAVICSPSGYTCFFLPRSVLNGRIFEKKVSEHKCVF